MQKIAFDRNILLSINAKKRLNTNVWDKMDIYAFWRAHTNTT